MNKVTTINLNGRAYQIEEAGYDALRKYLDQAEAKLKDDPDKAEIMADLEQAIADKCDARLSPRKNVMTAGEIEDIIKAMGPVDGGSAHAHVSAAPGPKRLYQIRQGSWIAGVCNGLAAYFGIDVTLVRVVFAILGLFSHGFWILIYIILAIVIPVARTDEELAAARGAKPFNTHDFIEQAKSRYEDFQKKHPNMPPGPEDPHSKESWRTWKQGMKDWKHELKADMRREKYARHESRHGWQNQPWQDSGGVGFFRFIMGLVIAALTVLWIFALWSVVEHGTLLGFALVAGYPLWIAVVFVSSLYFVAILPFKLFMKNASPWRWHWGRYSFFNDFMQSIFFVLAIYLAVRLGRELFPIVDAGYQMVVAYLHTMIH